MAQAPHLSQPRQSPGERVDAVVYRQGVCVASPTNLSETFKLLDADPATMAWVALDQPAKSTLLAAAAEFGLHELAVEDAIVAHQRPKMERYGDTLFLVLRAARYLDEPEAVEFGEIHLFVGPRFVLTVRHGHAPDIEVARAAVQRSPHLIAQGPEAVMYTILDTVVDLYAPVVAGLQNDVDEIETEVFDGQPDVSRRIYGLTREVIEFQRATHGLMDVLGSLMAGFEKHGIHEELQRYLRDVADHATTVAERADGFRELLAGILTVNASLISKAQNDEMRRLAEAGYAQNEQIKRISAWAAILFAPTLIGTVYGMNFIHMPELRWFAGYPMALLLMALVSGVLYGSFRHRGWL
jgi:magnesium transporter